MGMLGPASPFGRYDFLIRRVHSLTGLIPIGAYLVFHLATNASIIDGLAAYQHRADQIHQLGPTTIFVLEWLFIFLPILFHGLIGMVIVARGDRNVGTYTYGGNVRYTLQRATGVIALFFILWHVFHMHGWIRAEWWLKDIAIPLGGHRFNPEDAYTAAVAIQSSWLVIAIYAIGVLACVYHLANGIWTMGITWGVWTSPKAQSWAKIPCVAFGLLLAVLGLGSLYGMVVATPEPTTTVKAEVGSGKSEVGRWKAEVGSGKSEITGASSSPTSDFRLPTSPSLAHEERSN
jgi:succinate dehydrogenase / fumarate reductase cytochrome b subunit